MPGDFCFIKRTRVLALRDRYVIFKLDLVRNAG